MEFNVICFHKQKRKQKTRPHRKYNVQNVSEKEGMLELDLTLKSL